MRCPWIILICVLAAGRVLAASFNEDFATDPELRGWRAFGNADLFRWNPVNQDLEVTWDSSKPNSYYYHPLGTILAKTDEVQLRFDLRLDEIAFGTTLGRPFTFELVVGLINSRDATSTNFFRGTGTESPNLIEFDYFPDSGFGATISTIIVSSNNQFIPSFTFPLELTKGDQFHVEMFYRAADQTLATTLERNGAPAGPVKEVKLGSSFTDFRVDTFAIASYSDQGADGSLLAKGHIDNVAVIVPDPPLTRLRLAADGQSPQATFDTKSGWRYTLERSEDLIAWNPAAPALLGSDLPEMIADNLSAPAKGRAFYRVRLDRP